MLQSRRKYLQVIYSKKDLYSKSKKNSKTQLRKPNKNCTKDMKTLHQSRYIDGKKAHEKVFNIINH